MEKITDVACVKNEIYKDSIYNLSKILVLKMSETFDEQQYEIYIHDDFAEVGLGKQKCKLWLRI